MKRKIELLPYPTIVDASRGEVEAINAVLKHYSSYIAALSTQRGYDEYGNAYLYVDEYLRRRLETKLITKMLTFNAA